MTSQFTVCALFYGDYPWLAQRLLESLRMAGEGYDIRYCFGLNNVCDTTQRAVTEFGKGRSGVSVYPGVSPYYKYPLMRRMLHTYKPTTPYVMWFDDDSWIHPDAPRDFFDQIAAKMQRYDLIGVPYHMYLRGNQKQFIEDQPWYNGKPVRSKIDFITGGWFTIRTELLIRHDWPPANFEHNGGDVMLGELCHQHDYRIGYWSRGLCINANGSGKCSTARRRGVSQQPIGTDYSPPRSQPAPTPYEKLSMIYGSRTHG